MTINSNKMSLSLSGGGYRAILFHIGALYRLNELGLLSKLDAISSVSGGAIVAGVLGLNWNKLKFNTKGVAINFNELILDPLWNFCDNNIDILASVTGLVCGSRYLEYKYDQLFNKKLISDLPDHPEFIYNTTNADTGSNCRFSHKGMYLYLHGRDSKLTNVSLAKVVAASSALSPWLAPVKIKSDHFTPNPNLIKEFTLLDGGNYDNLGVHAINHYPIKFISDAGIPINLQSSKGFGQFWSNRISRPVTIALDYNSRLLYRDSVSKMISGLNLGAMWALKHPISRYPGHLTMPFNVNSKWESYICAIPTRLKRLTDYDKGHLVNWGYIYCDLSIRSYYLPDTQIPIRLPIPNCDFNDPPMLT